MVDNDQSASSAPASTPSGSEPHHPRFRRILMALDSASEDSSAVEAAAVFASRLQAELLGLFVEDIDLVRLAEHREVSACSTVSATKRNIVADHLKRALRAQLAHSRLAVERAAERQRIKATFAVRQGRLATEVLSAAGDVDLVIMGWTAGGGSVSLATQRVAPAPIARAVAEEAPRSVLLLRPGSPVSGPVLLAYDGSEAARQALAAASEIADRNGGGIEVALLTGRVDQAETLRREVEKALAGTRLTVGVVHIPKGELTDLCRWARRERVSLMVVSAGQSIVKGEGIRQLLERIGCSLLLVR